jgi:AcrR family transcriptional regulator
MGMEAASADRRREAGLRTQARLLEAALTMISERGEDGVTLRELTDAAGANVAAVSYHFGSLQRLCDAAVEHALERYLDDQQEALSALRPEATLEALTAAFARPMIRALAAGGRDLAILRIVSRAALDPPQGWDRFDARFEAIRADALRVLKTTIPDVKNRELILRVRCVAGMLNWLALAPINAELGTMSEKQLERLLVPIIAGAFRGTTPG